MRNDSVSIAAISENSFRVCELSPIEGGAAPDFELPTVRGTRFRLSDLRACRPVVLEFASITCPLARAARKGMLELFADFGDRVEFVSVYTNEANPGPGYPIAVTAEEKARFARDWVFRDRVLWTVAIDSPEGSVHLAYGALPNGVFVIGRSGLVHTRMRWAGEDERLRAALAAVTGPSHVPTMAS